LPVLVIHNAEVIHQAVLKKKYHVLVRKQSFNQLKW